MGVKKQIFVGLAAAVMLVLAAGFVSAVCSPYKCDDADNGVFSFALDPAEGYKKLLGRKWDIGECSYPYWKKCGILGSQTCNKNTGLCVEGSSGDATKNCLDRCYGPDKWGNNFVVSMNKLPSGNDCSVPFEGCTYTNCLKCESGKCENAKCGVGGSGGGTGGGGSAITCSFGGTIYSEGQTRCTSDGNQWRCTYSSWVYDGECSGGGSATCPDRCYGPDSNGNVFVLSMNKIPSGSGYHQFTVDGCTYYYYLPCTSGNCDKENAQCRVGGGGGDTGDEGVGLSASLVSFYTPKTYMSPGETAKLSVTVRNTGNAALPETTKVWFYVKKPGSEKHEYICDKLVGSLSYGQFAVNDVDCYWQIPKDAAGGEYEFVAQVFAEKKGGGYTRLSDLVASTVTVKGSTGGGGESTDCPDRCYGPDSNGNVFVLSMNKIPSGSGYHQFTVDGCTYYYYLPCTSGNCDEETAKCGVGGSGGGTGGGATATKYLCYSGNPHTDGLYWRYQVDEKGNTILDASGQTKWDVCNYGYECRVNDGECVKGGNSGSEGSGTYSAKYPIILVHGWNGDTSSLRPMQEELQKDGIAYNLGDIDSDSELSTCYGLKSVSVGANLEYYGDGTGKGIPYYADKLATAVKDLKDCTGSQKVTIVAHSMGGLVARKFMQNIYDGKYGHESVNKLILLETPNYGIPPSLAFLGEHVLDPDVDQMSPGSDFLNELNSNREECKYRNSKIVTIGSRTRGEALLGGIATGGVEPLALWAIAAQAEADVCISDSAEGVLAGLKGLLSKVWSEINPFPTASASALVPIISAELAETKYYGITGCTHSTVTPSMDLTDLAIAEPECTVAYKYVKKHIE